jgi:hypothetical protein
MVLVTMCGVIRPFANRLIMAPFGLLLFVAVRNAIIYQETPEWVLAVREGGTPTL